MRKSSNPQLQHGNNSHMYTQIGQPQLKDLIEISAINTQTHLEFISKQTHRTNQQTLKHIYAEQISLEQCIIGYQTYHKHQLNVYLVE